MDGDTTKELKSVEGHMCRQHVDLRHRIEGAEESLKRMTILVGEMREDVAVVKEFAVEMKEAKVVTRLSALEQFKKTAMTLIGGLGAAIGAAITWLKGG